MLPLNIVPTLLHFMLKNKQLNSQTTEDNVNTDSLYKSLSAPRSQNRSLSVLEHISICQMTTHRTLLSGLHPYKWKTKGYHSDLIHLYSSLLWHKCPNKSKIVQIPVLKISVRILVSSKKKRSIQKPFIQSKDM